MSAKSLLQKYSGSSSPRINEPVRMPGGVQDQTEELPSNINHWPAAWLDRLRVTARVIGQLSSLDELDAEAAAEIAVRCEFSWQQGCRTNPMGLE